jgi:UDP-N-acetylglucosamine transferase subunit ALG13
VILVTTGTVKGYREMIRRMDELAAGPLRGEAVIAQIANCDYEPRHMAWFRYMERIDLLFRRAELIVGHGGTGTTIEALKLGKRFVAVGDPSLPDDHQGEFLSALAPRGALVHCTDLDRLEEAIETARATAPSPIDPSWFGRAIGRAIEDDLNGRSVVRVSGDVCHCSVSSGGAVLGVVTAGETPAATDAARAEARGSGECSVGYPEWSDRRAVASVLPPGPAALRRAHRRARRQMRRERLGERVRQYWPLVTGAYPRFIYHDAADTDGIVPVFAQHQLPSEAFERVLQYLSDNRYRTLNTVELRERLSGEVVPRREVMLTFDDGLRWVYEVAFPLLRRYDAKVVCFVCPGLIEDHHGAGESAESNLCTWDMLREMASSGLVDVQGHGLRHARVWVDRRVIGFLGEHSGWSVGNERLIESFDRAGPSGSAPPCRTPGMPVRRHRAGFLAPRRFHDPVFTEQCLRWIEEFGPAFAEDPKWWGRAGGRRGLRSTGHWITGSTRGREMLGALCEARRLLAERISPASARHFAWPWWRGCAMAQAAAREAGFEMVFWGPTPMRRGCGAADLDPRRIPRMSLDWYERLPGRDCVPLQRLLARKLGERFQGRT